MERTTAFIPALSPPEVRIAIFMVVSMLYQWEVLGRERKDGWWLSNVKRDQRTLGKFRETGWPQVVVLLNICCSVLLIEHRPRVEPKVRLQAKHCFTCVRH
jgi:G:T-mismatch repair DNA endonuclease (very short patch repair protein)